MKLAKKIQRTLDKNLVKGLLETVVRNKQGKASDRDVEKMESILLKSFDDKKAFEIVFTISSLGELRAFTEITNEQVFTALECLGFELV